MKEKRGICTVCQKRPRAINYYDAKGKVHYRSVCDVCNSAGKTTKHIKPRWQRSGYKKKSVCGRCGFRAAYPEQIQVYHIDGNLNNTDINNLRCICLNCVIEVAHDDLPWKQGDLISDF